jgi:hypothetical protein
MRQVRIDKSLEAAVNRWIAAALLQWDEVKLPDEPIPPEIISRVTMGPRHHRRTDWQRT